VPNRWQADCPEENGVTFAGGILATSFDIRASFLKIGSARINFGYGEWCFAH
jgi:hypothetical protein